MKNIFVLLMFIMPQMVFAWGGRGHDAICQAAVHLVKNKDLSDFLKSRPHVMGHLCNIPDVQWRNMEKKITQHGDPTHYVNPELLGLAAQDVPLDLSEIIQKYSDTDGATDKNTKIGSVPLNMGTNWWRADQMVRRGIEHGKQIATSEAPTNSKEAQNENLAYNKAVYEMMVSMGVLGHFVGDNSQPFHNTTDYDGWAANQGGIHSYYEEQSVAQLGPELVSEVVKKSKKLKNLKFLNGKNPVEKMRNLATIAVSEVKTVLKVDPIIKNSQLKIEKGMSLKTPAVRQPPEIGAKRFEKFIVEDMARSARLLAMFWDEIFEQSGAPDLKAYRSYRYPLTVEFIMPDYYDTQNESKK